jgi:hypothetical protein
MDQLPHAVDAFVKTGNADVKFSGCFTDANRGSIVLHLDDACHVVALVFCNEIDGTVPQQTIVEGMRVSIPPWFGKSASFSMPM